MEMELPARAKLRRMVEEELPAAIDEFEAEESGRVGAADGLRDAARDALVKLRKELPK